ncbi:dienelactone hydrolase family protein [Kamptonema formosum]|uniref:dienelactone hydrolase family protein n=1 Tax=Kamptonema formosum TaxID=331992 RepID=UPI000476990D|nr:dienelactone hydrolase family protein [Oscillatoria sp. PCC 10802]
MDRTSKIKVEHRSVQVPSGPISLEGHLSVPENARGVVLFADGSGSSRHSPRNRYVAETLNQAGFATLLADLLSPDEEAEDRQKEHLRFNIDFLAERLIDATEWIAQSLDTHHLKIGYFGAGTGAAAALAAAAKLGEAISAVVSRGGRPDLAGTALPNVKAPALLIVGGNDLPVIDMNRGALEKLGGEKKLEIVPGATHLFEEPGALEEVAQLAREWFAHYLVRVKQPVAI